MKRKWKILIAVAAVLVVIMILAVVFIDHLAKAGLQKGATFALGVDATVEGVDVSLLGGSVDIKGLAVSNPEGYGDGNILELGRAFASVKPSSLMGDVVEIGEIVLESPIVKLRQQGLKTNLSVILANLEGSEETAEDSSESMKLKVGSISLTGAVFEYSLAGAPPVKIPLPDVHIKDISTGDDTTVTLASVIKQILVSMATSAGSAGGDVLPDDIAKGLNTVVEGAGAGVKKTVEEAGDAIRGIGGVFRGIVGKDEGAEEDAPE